ncbi:hypothetical protein [Clostridium cellulovorans]|uniref:hypothetical protein n=1 Tax=Clostridium cellulovorans TaxID=1493 RepID=UPI0002F35940|nr:hypothetical protein [Clostridium cellulovorans]
MAKFRDGFEYEKLVKSTRSARELTRDISLFCRKLKNLAKLLSNIRVNALICI